jgi:hypothetical protein
MVILQILTWLKPLSFQRKFSAVHFQLFPSIIFLYFFFQFSLEKDWGKYRNNSSSICLISPVDYLRLLMAPKKELNKTTFLTYIQWRNELALKTNLRTTLLNLASPQMQVMTTCHIVKHKWSATLVSPSWHGTTCPSLQPELLVNVNSALERIFLAYAGSMLAFTGYWDRCYLRRP